MTLPARPNNTWGKDKYWEDVKWYQYNMMTVNKMNLTRKKKDCCKNITKTMTESINILKNSKRQLSKQEKQRLYELCESRWNNLYGLVGS